MVASQNQDAKKFLEGILNAGHGIQGIAIHDKEGCCLIKATKPSCPERTMGVKFLSAFSVLSDQAAKMNLGKNNKMFNFYGQHQIAQFRVEPLIVTVVAAAAANTGYIAALDVQLQPLLQLLQPLVRPH